MYCPDCGTPIPEGGVCPKCSSAAPAGAPAPAAPPADKGKKPVLTKGSKTYSALLTAALVFPASICTAIDLSFHRYDFWFGYVVGALLVVWVCLVLPSLKLFSAPINALISFAAIMGYTSFVIYKTGHLEWLYKRALPLFILFALFVAADVALVSFKKVNWLTVLSAVSFEVGIYLIAIEITYLTANAYTFAESFKHLHWSPILAAGFISVAAVFLAFAYVGKINKDKGSGE